MACLQVAALSTAFQHLQDPMVKDLKRKLEETTLEMERARMEREDFRQGGGPSDVWGSPAANSPLSLRRYTENLQRMLCRQSQRLATCSIWAKLTRLDGA